MVLGAVILATPIGEVLDTRQDYGGRRVNAFGLVNGRLFACIDTSRDNAWRIISVRRASKQEQLLFLP